jgi:alpha-galactosidase
MLMAIALVTQSPSGGAEAQVTKKHLVAPTPPMGWNSWNGFGGNINEQLIMETADAMVSSGMKDAGYQYVVIDDLWHQGRSTRSWAKEDQTKPGRDANNVLIADRVKFPHGIKYVADYVHFKGLRFGLYTVPGVSTCAGCTGSEGFEALDLKTFAEWGVDYIKLDGCGVGASSQDVLLRWRGLIDKLDRPIVLSVNLPVFDSIGDFADLWRTTTDIMALWDYGREFHFMASVSDIIDLQAGLDSLQHPGSWNDPDMLQVGNGKLTDDENRAHFSMGAMFGAPLMAGNDLRSISESTRQILTHSEIIAIDQDPAGEMGRKVRDFKPGLQVWAKRLSQYGAVAVALLNRTESASEIQVEFKDIGIRGEAQVREVWARKDRGVFKESFAASVPPHGVVVLKVNSFEHLGPFAPLPVIPQEGVTLQPEDLGHYYGGGKVETTCEGFTGSGYVRGRNHEWRPLEIIWVTPYAKLGKHDLKVRYANGGETTLQYTIHTATSPGQTIAFPPTKGWSDWQTVTVTMPLANGINHVALECAESAKMNDLAIDSLEVVPSKQPSASTMR